MFLRHPVTTSFTGDSRFGVATNLIDISKIDQLIERGQRTELLPGLEDLFQEASDIWDDNENDFHFRDFIAADYEKVYQALALVKDQAETFLEFGSGLGVIASTAGMLGYEAYGIEIDPKLVRRSQELADKYETTAEFSFGSFIPNGYEWSAEFEDEFFKTILDEQDGYGDLDMELRGLRSRLRLSLARRAAVLPRHKAPLRTRRWAVHDVRCPRGNQHRTNPAP